MRTVEELAVEAGFVMRDGEITDGYWGFTAEVKLLAALVAEQCAQIVDREFDDQLAQMAIRAAFPMPKP